MTKQAPVRGRVALVAGATGLLAAGALGGAILVSGVGANATTLTSTATSTSAPSSTESNEPAHGSAAHESTEKAVTGTDATKAQAAAVKAVGTGTGTAGAVTADIRGTGYEVTVKKADGSTVEVHLDSSFAVRDHGGPNR
ncbi:MAG: hypothetical protein M3N46_14270 [Actinomycetota bacterium]|nr:hypothetical protein [Actinomycetota bacterium]